MTSTSRTVICQESNTDNADLQNNKYNYNVAKSVATPDGGESYTIIWQSKNQYAPKITVAWQVNYALNWTVTLPTVGVAVSLGGDWHSCEKGESLDLNSVGAWVKSSLPNKDPNSLQVGSNGYTSEVYIIVGVDPGNGAWEAIWVDQDALLPNGTGNYTPIEHARTWWQEGTQSGTMIATQKLKVLDIDLTNRNGVTNTFLEYVHFNASSGDWDPVSDTPFTLSRVRAINGNGDNAAGGVVSRSVQFQWSIVAANRDNVIALIREALSQVYDPVNVAMKTGQILTVTIGNRSGPLPSVATIDAAIDLALTSAATYQPYLFPTNVSWSIGDVQSSAAPNVDIIRFIRFVIAIAGANRPAILAAVGAALRAYFRPSVTFQYVFVDGSTIKITFKGASSVAADDYTTNTLSAINSVLKKNANLFPAGEDAKVTMM